MVWDLSKAYKVAHTTDHWRWGEEKDDWKTYSITRMNYGDQCAMCGLEVSKVKVILGCPLILRQLA